MTDYEMDPISAAEVVADEKHLKYERSRLAVMNILDKKNLFNFGRQYLCFIPKS